MKTRNRGQEFVKDRLRPMCADLATWEPSAMLSGITGQTLYDSLDDKPESRTGTGFTVPQPTDTALAFCALVGIANFPVIHQVHRIGVTPGAYPYNALHPRLMVLPVLFGRDASAQPEDTKSAQTGGVTLPGYEPCCVATPIVGWLTMSERQQTAVFGSRHFHVRTGG